MPKLKRSKFYIIVSKKNFLYGSFSCNRRKEALEYKKNLEVIHNQKFRLIKK